MTEDKQPNNIQEEPLAQGAQETQEEVKTGLVQGEKALSDALADSIVYACEQGANSLIFLDMDFASWPLSEPRVLSALSTWASSTSNQRKLTVLATTYKMVEERQGAWKRWRQRWDSRVACLKVMPEFDPNLPTVFWSDAIQVVVRNKETFTGHISTEKGVLMPEKAKVNEWLGRSEPDFPASTTGLW